MNISSVCWGRLYPVISLLLCSMVVLAADLGLLSIYDAAIVAFTIAIFFPSVSPLLLLTITSIQDAPGMAGVAWYVGFTLVGSILFAYAVIRSFLKGEDFLTVNIWGVCATIVILFATVVSLVNVMFSGYEQVSERSPLMVGGLMIFMVWVGILAVQILKYEPEGRKAVIWVVVMLLIHGIGIALLQAIVDPMLMTSSYGLEEIKNALQLTQVTGLGIPRIHGAFLSPNAFALCMTLLALVGLAHREYELISIKFVGVWCVFGVVLCLLSQSKSISLLFILTTIFMLLQIKAWRLVIALCLLCLPVLSWVIVSQAPDDLVSAFRISHELSGDSYRAQAWHAVILNFNWYDWLIGIGLSHWPVFFESYIGVRLADPHTWLLSIPGTFGMPGVIFYFAVIFSLIKVVNKGVGSTKAVAMSMLVLLLVKDMFSVQYLIGNTPLSFLIWFILSMTISKYPRQVIAAQ